MWCWRILDYQNFKCRKRLIGKLVEEYSEDINGNEMVYNAALNDYKKVCNVCAIYIVLFIITSIGISSVLFYFHWYLTLVLILKQ